MNSYEEDKHWLSTRGYKVSAPIALNFTEIVTRNYADGMDIETARKEAAIVMNLS
jgi:hypothetical protein